MVMRYHWGLAVGHVYVRDVSATTTAKAMEQGNGADEDDDTENVEMENVHESINPAHDSDSASAPEDSESDGDVEDNYDDDEFLARYEMYGDSQDVEYYE